MEQGSQVGRKHYDACGHLAHECRLYAVFADLSTDRFNQQGTVYQRQSERSEDRLSDVTQPLAVGDRRATFINPSGGHAMSGLCDRGLSQRRNRAVLNPAATTVDNPAGLVLVGCSSARHQPSMMVDKQACTVRCEAHELALMREPWRRACRGHGPRYTRVS